MKKFMFAVITCAVLISGCNSSELDNRSSTTQQLSESKTQIGGQSTSENTNIEPKPESSSSQSASSSTVLDNSNVPEPPTNKENDMKIEITVNGRTFFPKVCRKIQ